MSANQTNILGFGGLTVLFGLLLWGDFYLLSITEVELWIPLLFSLGGAVILWFIMRYVWELLLPKTNFILRFLIHITFFTVTVGCILLLLNWGGAEGIFSTDQYSVQGLFGWPVIIH